MSMLFADSFLLRVYNIEVHEHCDGHDVKCFLLPYSLKEKE